MLLGCQLNLPRVTSRGVCRLPELYEAAIPASPVQSAFPIHRSSHRRTLGKRHQGAAALHGDAFGRSFTKGTARARPSGLLVQGVGAGAGAGVSVYQNVSLVAGGGIGFPLLSLITVCLTFHSVRFAVTVTTVSFPWVDFLTEYS